MLLVKTKERSIVANDRRLLCVNQSMDRLQKQNEISVFVATAVFFRELMMAMDFIQSTKVSPRHSTFSPLGREK